MTPSDLPVEALAKKLERTTYIDDRHGVGSVLTEAASLLRSLAAERDVLRAALRPFATALSECSGIPDGHEVSVSIEWGYGGNDGGDAGSDEAVLSIGDFRRARSTLSTEGGSR